MVGIVGCMALAAASVLGVLSLLSVVLSTSPESAILMAWGSLFLSLLAAGAASALILVCDQRRVPASVGIAVTVLFVAAIVIVVMVLRLVVYYI
jgi:hypothetical protein